jgi:hypothetical protein
VLPDGTHIPAGTASWKDLEVLYSLEKEHLITMARTLCKKAVLPIGFLKYSTSVFLFLLHQTLVVLIYGIIS